MKLTDSVSAVDFASDGGLRPVSEETFEIWGFPSLHYTRHTRASGQVLLLDEALQRKSGRAKWKQAVESFQRYQIKFHYSCQLHHQSYSPEHFSLPQIFPFWMIFSQSMPRYQHCHCQWCKIPKKKKIPNIPVCFTSRIKQTLSLSCTSLKYW